jgi:hypothetical protein
MECVCVVFSRDFFVGTRRANGFTVFKNEKRFWNGRNWAATSLLRVSNYCECFGLLFAVFARTQKCILKQDL